jgi:hypothetical protein
LQRGGLPRWSNLIFIAKQSPVSIAPCQVPSGSTSLYRQTLKFPTRDLGLVKYGRFSGISIARASDRFDGKFTLEIVIV